MATAFSSSERSSRRACPHCGEPLKRVPILYGYPDAEAFEKAERGEVVLGGCVVSGDDPEFGCANCGEPVADG